VLIACPTAAQEILYGSSIIDFLGALARHCGKREAATEQPSPSP
jgi:hypothetical protein